MNHINLDSQDDAIKQFVLGLPVDEVGSVLEINGHAVAFVLPPPKSTNGHVPSVQWTEEKNARRCELLDQKYASGLNANETLELAQLQEEMMRFRQRVAPLPLDDARKLHQELLSKAAAQETSP